MQKTKRQPLIDTNVLKFPVRKKTPEPKPGWSEQHLKFIRTQPCIKHGVRAEPHHLLHVPESIGGCRGMSLKNPDMFTIPISHALHMVLHELVPLTAVSKEAWFWELNDLPDDPITTALRYALMSPDQDIKQLAKERMEIWQKS